MAWPLDRILHRRQPQRNPVSNLTHSPPWKNYTGFKMWSMLIVLEPEMSTIRLCQVMKRAPNVMPFFQSLNWPRLSSHGCLELLVHLLYLPSAGAIDASPFQVSTMMGIEPRAFYMLDKDSTNGTTFPTLLILLLKHQLFNWGKTNKWGIN